MTIAIQELVIRDVAPVDVGQISRLLAAAMGDQPVARWVTPDDVERRRRGPGYFAIFAEYAVQYGEVYATSDPDNGGLAGVALWLPFTAMIPPPADYDRRVKEAVGDGYDRVCVLDASLEERHPIEPHHYLAFLAVRPDMQDRGIGSALLERHHARLDAAGIPAYLEANHPRNRELYKRHGYKCGDAIQLPDGPPLWPMWRPSTYR